ncbi:hypothetical protein BJ508DRAFT_324138 [Ascobolus immersus RN42]|uniref:Uncharacterized protein n=1 Tax=Ascobolus immersus RN42 TaxID=1160509 RepID=A0A3N4IGG5_ASCIM|nr:hypothetical protein BJ508DRAFT_324138 [Ascobolus immersus RN42]
METTTNSHGNNASEDPFNAKVFSLLEELIKARRCAQDVLGKLLVMVNTLEDTRRPERRKALQELEQLRESKPVKKKKLLKVHRRLIANKPIGVWKKEFDEKNAILGVRDKFWADERTFFRPKLREDVKEAVVGASELGDVLKVQGMLKHHLEIWKKLHRHPAFMGFKYALDGEMAWRRPHYTYVFLQETMFSGEGQIIVDLVQEGLDKVLKELGDSKSAIESTCFDMLRHQRYRRAALLEAGEDFEPKLSGGKADREVGQVQVGLNVVSTEPPSVSTASPPVSTVTAPPPVSTAPPVSTTPPVSIAAPHLQNELVPYMAVRDPGNATGSLGKRKREDEEGDDLPRKKAG